MTSMMHSTTRLGAAFLLLAVLLTMCFPLALSAEEAAETPAFYAEPVLLRADDYTEALTGFRLVVDNPDDLALTLTCSVYAAGDMTGAITQDSPWITVTAMEQPEEQEDAAVLSTPAFTVDFHKPADITVEDPDYIDMPVFLRPVSVSGTTIYTLAPGYLIEFRVTGGDAADDGTYALDYSTVYTPDRNLVSFALERPAKLIVQLTQNEGESGSVAIDVLNPGSILYLRDALMQDKDAFLAEYGITDAQLYIQYDFTRMDVPSAYDAEADSAPDAVWSPETLQPIQISDMDLNAGLGETLTGDFDSEEFRARFPEDTFSEVTIPAPEDDETAEDTVVSVIDTETVTLSTRVRYVLALTAPDGTVYYNKTEFTDPFYCGASNSLVSDPSAMDAPVLSDPVFSTDENGDTVLSFHVKSNDSVRDTAFWCIAYGKSGVSYALELSVNGSEWTAYEGDIAAAPAPTEDGDFSVVLAGEKLNEYAYIRARLRYTADEIPLQSEYSDAIAFDIRPAETVTAPVSENTLPLYTEDTAGEGELKYICPICGICPAPYGVCLFLWIGAALLIVLLIVLIIAAIPKKKYCPRCSAVCRPDEKTCTTCGYRFVGSMPEIEDTTDEIPTPGKPASKEDEDAFFAAGMASDSAKPAEKTEEPAPQAPKAASVPAPEAPQTAAAPAAATAKPDAAFLAELKRKMAAVKAGQKQTFTPEEIAYIKALREKASAPKTPATPAPVSADDTATRELPPIVHAVRSEAPAPAAKPAAEAAESREAQIARLRALRTKQLAAEKEAAPIPAPETPKPADAPRRVEKPAKQIKCPACAVPNPETNGQCYICGTRLK